jgi:hypothetical protein
VLGSADGRRLVVLMELVLVRLVVCPLVEVELLLLMLLGGGVEECVSPLVLSTPLQPRSRVSLVEEMVVHRRRCEVILTGK